MGMRLPPVNLGATNILDGGWVRTKEGWFFFQFLEHYSSHKFLDGEGKLLGGIRSPQYKYWAGITEVGYQTEHYLFSLGKLGFSVVVPYVFSLSIEKNALGLSSSGGGLSDIQLTVFLQSDQIKYNDRPFFQHRLSLDVSFPTGKNGEPQKTINPGVDFIFINPYWAATIKITPRWAAGWDLYYLWNGKDKKTHTQAGQAIHLNCSTEFEVIPNLWVSACCYFLQQITDDTLRGKPIPKSRERVLGLGPGAMYQFSEDTYLFGYLYVESHVRSRPQGIRFLCRFVQNF